MIIINIIIINQTSFTCFEIYRPYSVLVPSYTPVLNFCANSSLVVGVFGDPLSFGRSGTGT